MDLLKLLVHWRWNKTKPTQKNCRNHSRFKDGRCQRNTHKKKFRTHVYLQEKILDPRSTHEKIIRIHNVPNRKTFGPIKYPREKISDLQNTHKKNIIPIWTHNGKMARWHGTHESHDGTIPTEFSTLPMYLLTCTQKMSTDLRSKIPTISPDISLRVPTFASQTRWHIQ